MLLSLNEKNILEHSGRISHELAESKANDEYNLYKEKQRAIEHFNSIKELDDDLKRLNRKR